MLLPRLVAAALALRQAPLLPEEYCQPQCPACKQNIIDFDKASSCQIGSLFLTNCGSCQICVTTYTIRNGTVALLSDITDTLAGQLNRCDGTGGAGAVSAIASQVSAFSSINSQMSASRTSEQFASRTDLSSILAPATWSSAYASGMAPVIAASAASAASLASKASAASRVAATGPSPAAITSMPTAAATGVGTGSVGPGPELNQTWIAGPVVGSILGLTTVILVIFCTRRKQSNKEEWELGNIKEISEDDQESSKSSGAEPEETGGKAMLHSECVPLKEMANTEIMAPVELPALEPVGMELLTPRETADHPKDWPLPISPLPALFAMTEIRDVRTGADSPKHDTFYHA